MTKTDQVWVVWVLIIKNIPKEVDSGTYNNMADKIETERFNKNAKEYAGIDEESLIADSYLDKEMITADTHPELVNRHPELDGKLAEDFRDEVSEGKIDVDDFTEEDMKSLGIYSSLIRLVQ